MSDQTLASPFAASIHATKPNLAVIGAGVVGLCTALAAQKEGYHVTLLDSNPPGKAASFGNAGYLATELMDPLGTKKVLKMAPKLWLDPKGPVCLPWKHFTKAAPWLLKFVAASSDERAEYSRKALLSLNAEAVPAWHRLMQDVGGEEHLISDGYLLVWEDPSKKTDAHEHLAHMRRFNIPCEYVEGARLAELEPTLAKRISHALYYPKATRVSDPFTVCQLLYQAFQERGGVFIQEPVMSLQAGSHNIEVHLARDQQALGQVIICGGAWSKQLLEQVGLTVPLEAERGYHVTYTGQEQLLNHVIGAAERRFVMSPLASGLRSVGMSEIGGVRLPPIQKRFAVLREHTAALLPDVTKDGIQVEEWMGHRPTLPDSLPVIDQHPSFPSLAFAFGHQHLGLTHAAITAELMLAKIQKQPASISLHAMRVDRF